MLQEGFILIKVHNMATKHSDDRIPFIASEAFTTQTHIYHHVFSDNEFYGTNYNKGHINELFIKTLQKKAQQ